MAPSVFGVFVILVVIAVHEVERLAQQGHQIIEVTIRQVAAADDEIHIPEAVLYVRAVQRIDHVIGHGQDFEAGH